MDSAGIASLKAAVAKLEKDPALLHASDLAFFKKYLVSLGAKLANS